MKPIHYILTCLIIVTIGCSNKPESCTCIRQDFENEVLVKTQVTKWEIEQEQDKEVCLSYNDRIIEDTNSTTGVFYRTDFNNCRIK